MFCELLLVTLPEVSYVLKPRSEGEGVTRSDDIITQASAQSLRHGIHFVL